MKRHSPKKLWTTLSDIQTTISVDDGTFSDFLELPVQRFRQLRNTKKAPSVCAIDSIAEKLNLDIEHMLGGNIDFTALSEHFFGNDAYVPDKYLVAAHSRRRTSAQILAYIGRFHGQSSKTALLRRFQIHETAFTDLNKTININFLSDLCATIETMGFSKSEIEKMGAYSFVQNRNTELGHILSSHKSLRSLHEDIFASTVGKYFDTNFHYKLIELTDEHCVFESIENRDICDELGMPHIGTKTTCAIKRGTTASLAKYLGHNNSKVQETHCIHHGDRSCRFLVSFRPLFGHRPQYLIQ